MAETTQNPVVYPTPSIVQTPVQTPTPEQVYSNANIVQASTAPVARPDLSDPFGLYDHYMNSPEIQAATKSVQDIQNLINASNQALRTTTRALEGQNERAMGTTGASLNLIGKQVGRARQLTADELSALSENKLAAVSYLDTLTNKATNLFNIAQKERSQIQDLIAQTGGKAGISYADSYENAVSKANDYMEKKAKDEAKEAYKKELKSQLTALGKSTKGLSTKELEKKLQKYNKSALAEAKKLSDIEYKLKVKELNKPYYKPESGDSNNLNIDRSNNGIADLIQQGVNSGDGWGQIIETLTAADVDTGENSFADKYLRYLYGYETDSPLNND